MVSLVCKETGYEFLVQRKGKTYREQPFDGVYVEGECSGYDDMFLTVDECYYENDPWKGIKMADHGEVWSLPWECEIINNCLQFCSTLRWMVRFPSCWTVKASLTVAVGSNSPSLKMFLICVVIFCLVLRKSSSICDRVSQTVS